MEKVEVGIDIGGTKMLLLAKTATGETSRKVATGIHFSGADADQAIAQFLEELQTPPHSIGIAVPGLVDQETETVIYSDVLPRLEGWVPSVKQTAACPVCLLNDADAALIEAKHEVGAPKNMALIVVGTGIGSSFWVDQQFLRGSQGWAGELGAIPIMTADGITILDSLAGGAPLLQRVGLDADQLAALVDQEDETALAAISEAGRSLGLGITVVMHLFNPEVVVLAGGTLRWRGYTEAAISSAQEHCIPQLWKACRIHVSHQGSLLVVRGITRAAAELAAELAAVKLTVAHDSV